MAQRLLQQRFIPTGDIAADTVQAALAEVDSEKLAKAQNLADLPDKAAARTNLTAAKLGVNADITSLENLTTLKLSGNSYQPLNSDAFLTGLTKTLRNDTNGFDQAQFATFIDRGNRLSFAAPTKVEFYNFTTNAWEVWNNPPNFLNLTDGRIDSIATITYTYRRFRLTYINVSNCRASYIYVSQQYLERAFSFLAEHSTDGISYTADTTGVQTFPNTINTGQYYYRTQSIGYNASNYARFTFDFAVSGGLPEGNTINLVQLQLVTFRNSPIFQGGSWSTYLPFSWDSSRNVSFPKDIFVNGTRYSISSTPPTSPVRGDKWDEIDANLDLVQQWFWNGTYWLSRNIINVHDRLNTNNNDDTTLLAVPTSSRNTNLFLLSWSTTNSIATLNDASNYYALSLSRTNESNVTTSIANTNTSLTAVGIYVTQSFTLNLHLDVNATGVRRLVVTKSRIGTPGILRYASVLTYREARI